MQRRLLIALHYTAIILENASHDNETQNTVSSRFHHPNQEMAAKVTWSFKCVEDD